MNIQQLSQEVTQMHADMCSALADPNRLLLLYALFEKPTTVNELSAELDIRQSTTSRHLKILRERGLVTANRQGQSVEYALADPRLIDAIDLLRTVLHDSISYRANLILETQNEERS
jgi:DNA-binding transcriptional ArsR family regulator